MKQRWDFVVEGTCKKKKKKKKNTIQALALYIADCMKQRLATLFD